MVGARTPERDEARPDLHRLSQRDRAQVAGMTNLNRAHCTTLTSRNIDMNTQSGLFRDSPSIMTGRMEATAAMLAFAILATPPAASAQSGELGGKEVVGAVCASCHATGAKGAPKIGDKKAWGKRSSQGLTSLTHHALKGIRDMPSHGGNPNLSDFEIQRAITYMVNQSGGKWTEPIDR